MAKHHTFIDWAYVYYFNCLFYYFDFQTVIHHSMEGNKVNSREEYKDALQSSTSSQEHTKSKVNK